MLRRPARGGVAPSSSDRGGDQGSGSRSRQAVRAERVFVVPRAILGGETTGSCRSRGVVLPSVGRNAVRHRPCPRVAGESQPVVVASRSASRPDAPLPVGKEALDEEVSAVVAAAADADGIGSAGARPIMPPKPEFSREVFRRRDRAARFWASSATSRAARSGMGRRGREDRTNQRRS